MSEAKPLDERVRELEEQVESLAQQLQHSQRAIFLITAKYLNGALPIPDKGISGKLIPFTVPTGWTVSFGPGADVSKSSLILGAMATPQNGRVH